MSARKKHEEKMVIVDLEASTETDEATATRAKALLAGVVTRLSSGWCKGEDAYGRDPHGNAYNLGVNAKGDYTISKKATSFCLVGAIAIESNGYTQAEFDVAMSALHKHLPRAREPWNDVGYDGRAVSFNETAGSLPPILAVLRKGMDTITVKG